MNKADRKRIGEEVRKRLLPEMQRILEFVAQEDRKQLRQIFLQGVRHIIADMGAKQDEIEVVVAAFMLSNLMFLEAVLDAHILGPVTPENLAKAEEVRAQLVEIVKLCTYIITVQDKDEDDNGRTTH